MAAYERVLPGQNAASKDCAHFVIDPKSGYGRDHVRPTFLVRQEAHGNQLAGCRKRISTG